MAFYLVEIMSYPLLGVVAVFVLFALFLLGFMLSGLLGLACKPLAMRGFLPATIGTYFFARAEH